MQQKDSWITISGIMVLLATVLTIPGFPATPTSSKVLYRFKGGNDAGHPLGALTFDAAGNLYGTTVQGGLETCDGSPCGTVFKLALKSGGTWSESVIYRFAGGSDGSGPWAGLISDSAGNFYGTTSGGGTSGGGTVFKLTPSANGKWTESVLYSFCQLSKCVDGLGPYASLTFDRAGNLYGTTMSGGAVGSGTVFELTPNSNGSWTEIVLINFGVNNNGSDPYGGLIFDLSTGNLYGTTVGGTSQGLYGTVFQLTSNSKGGWSQNVLYSFKGGKDGSGPRASLVLDKVGNLYGSTCFGGGSTSCSSGCGTIFELKPKSNGKWTESVLHRFNSDEGANPYAGLTFDPAGNIYGATVYGGSSNLGLVFKLVPRRTGSWAYSVFFSMDGTLGENPFGTPIFNNTGDKLYGTAGSCIEGGHCRGIVFEVTP